MSWSNCVLTWTCISLCPGKVFGDTNVWLCAVSIAAAFQISGRSSDKDRELDYTAFTTGFISWVLHLVRFSIIYIFWWSVQPSSTFWMHHHSEIREDSRPYSPNFCCSRSIIEQCCPILDLHSPGQRSRTKLDRGNSFLYFSALVVLVSGLAEREKHPLTIFFHDLRWQLSYIRKTIEKERLINYLLHIL